MKLLILGGSGGVGKRLIRPAVEQRHTVTVLMRSRQPVPGSVRLVLDDVLRPGCLSEAVAGQEVVEQIPDFPRTGRSRRADVAAWMLQHVTGELSDRLPIISGAQT